MVWKRLLGQEIEACGASKPREERVCKSSKMRLKSIISDAAELRYLRTEKGILDLATWKLSVTEDRRGLI